MPGMMDTILNLGLNDKSVAGLAAKTGNPRFAWDCYRRFIQMFGNVVLGIDKDKFEHELSAVKKKYKAKTDVELDAKALDEVIARYKAMVLRGDRTQPFPQDPRAQLVGARDAVFESWMNPRAITYRKLNDIPHDLGTAVNVQAMVFGNMGDTSATGVGFTRNPSTGAKEFYGEFLQNAQGEDVVAGIRTPHPIADLEERDAGGLPAAARDHRPGSSGTTRTCRTSSSRSRRARSTCSRPATASGRGWPRCSIAVDMCEEGLITKKEALLKVEPQALDQLLHPIFDPKARKRVAVAAKGLPASPGAATGRRSSSPPTTRWPGRRRARRSCSSGWRRCPTTSTACRVAQGILTATGGMTSHAAVVGRQMGKPSVVGCGALDINAKAKTLKVAGKVVREGDSDLDRRLDRRGDAGGGADERLRGHPGGRRAAQAREVGALPEVREAAGLGRRGPPARDPRQRRRAHGRQGGVRLRRARHRPVPHRAHVLRRGPAAARREDDPRRRPRPARASTSRSGSRSGSRRRRAARRPSSGRSWRRSRRSTASTSRTTRPRSRSSCRCRRPTSPASSGRCTATPVTIRTLDPPLHEFLPKREELMVEIATLKAQSGSKNKKRDRGQGEAAARGRGAARVQPDARPPRLPARHHLPRDHEDAGAGHLRGGACQVSKKGIPVKPEVMIPLVGHVEELKRQKAIVLEAAAARCSARTARASTT